MHQYKRFRQNREHADFSWTQLGAFGNDAFAFLDVFALWTNIGTLGFWLENPDVSCGRFREFDPHHGIGSIRNRGAGHDANGFTGPHGFRGNLAGLHVFDDRQFRRLGNFVLFPDIFPPDGKPVHGRIVPRGIISWRYDIFPQHPSQCVQQSDFLAPQRGGGVQHDLLSLCERG